AAASDLTQEVQLRMARGFARFRGETLPQLQAWTRTIAANVLRDRFRNGDPPVGPLPETVPAPEPVLPTVDAEATARLMAALEDLPGHYRAIMEGRLFDGLSCVEIAQRIGQLPGTVRIWCFRAVQQLNQRLRGRP